MSGTRILVVEDERIVALDVRSRLINLGYEIAGIVSTGEEAVRAVEQLNPNLVLMDIQLKGRIDGVEAAERIRSRFNTPVIYLTAYADDQTLDRAKVTEPFAYLLKPFEEKELHSAIQMALYRHKAEERLRESEERFRSLIENSSDIVLILDGTGAVRYAGPSVTRVLGYDPDDLVGKSISDFLHPDEVSTILADLERISRGHVDLITGEARVRHHDGTWRILEAVGQNRLDDPAVKGFVFNLRDVTERRQAEDTLREREQFLALLNGITRAALETPDFRTTLQTLADRLGDVIGADGCYLSLWDEERQKVVPGAAYGQWDERFHSLRLEPGEVTLAESVLREGRTLVVEDAMDSPYVSRRIAEQFPDRSLLGLPLMAGAEKLGAALIAFHEPHQFTSDELTRGEQAASHVALAVAKAQLLEKQRQQRLIAETLADVTLALTSLTNHAAVLDEILRQAQRIVPHRASNIALLERETLRTVHWQGYKGLGPGWEEKISQLVQPLEEWPVDAEAVRSRDPLVIPDTREAPGWVDMEETAWIRSYLAVPICVRERVLGLLRLDGDKPGQFRDEDAQRLVPLANAAAIAIENAQLYAEARQRVDELETLRNTSLQLTSSLDPSKVLDGIAEGALGLVGATDCHIYLWDEKTERFTFGAALWKDGRREPAVEMPRPDGFTAAVARAAEVIVINDATDHPLFTTPEAREWNVHAIAGFPLKRAGRVAGVFTMAFLEPHTFTEDELRVLDLLADQAVIAIENARLVEGLEAEVAARTAEIVAEKETSEAILHSVGDAIMMSDPEMRIRFVNPAFSTLTGYSLEELVGRRADMEGAGVDAAHIGQSILQGLKRGEVWQGEVIGYRKDGRTYDAALTIAPVYDAEGTLLGYVSSHRDISRIKELDRARRRFITNVSHQLRTPVTNVKLYARLLKIGHHPEKAGEYLRVLEQQADQLSHLVQDILELTTLDSGQTVIEWKPISLSAIIEEVVSHYEGRAEAAGLTLTIGELLDPRGVMGDPARLAQAVEELLENALRFTPAGGEITVSAAATEDEGRRWTTVRVRDDGPGISEEEQERIFDRFYRGSVADAGHIFGTGLGLSIVDEIMRAHGGRVTVDSAVGGGSTFTLWLPALEE